MNHVRTTWTQCVLWSLGKGAMLPMRQLCTKYRVLCHIETVHAQMSGKVSCIPFEVRVYKIQTPYTTLRQAAFPMRWECIKYKPCRSPGDNACSEVWEKYPCSALGNSVQNTKHVCHMRRERMHWSFWQFLDCRCKWCALWIRNGRLLLTMSNVSGS